MDSARPDDEWLVAAVGEATEAIAAIHAAGQDELTETARRAPRIRETGPGGGRDTDVGALQERVVHARDARSAPGDPDPQAPGHEPAAGDLALPGSWPPVDDTAPAMPSPQTRPEASPHSNGRRPDGP